MCDAVRERPDGEDEGEELDPRVEVELDNLNKASTDINILEKELDEARAVFRQQLTDAARNLKHLSNNLGNNIDKARPYFEALSQAKKAQQECVNAAMTYERACQLHKGARETISVAEEKLMLNPGMFDAAWQEMLNNANIKIMEAENERSLNENLHQEAAMAYRELEKRASQLEKQLKKSINKARPYFEQKAQYLGYLEDQKVRVQGLEASYVAAKSLYSKSLRNLETISEDIHKKRNTHDVPKPNALSADREECIGAESEKPSRRQSLQRRQSEDRIKQVLLHQRNERKTHFRSGRFRSSLLIDLDVDFDFDDSVDFNEPTKSPSSKSVDMGCINMQYYDDYQVLDIAPFLEIERRKSLTPRLSQSTIPETEELTIQSSKDSHCLRPRTLSSEFIQTSKVSKSHGARSLSVGSPEFTEIDTLQKRKSSEFEIISSKEHVSELSTANSSFPIGLANKDSKQAPIHQISSIAEIEGDEIQLDVISNTSLNQSKNQKDKEDGDRLYNSVSFECINSHIPFSETEENQKSKKHDEGDNVTEPGGLVNSSNVLTSKIAESTNRIIRQTISQEHNVFSTDINTKHEILTEPIQKVVTELLQEEVTKPTQEVIAELIQEVVTEPSKEAVTELTPEVVKNPIQEVVTKPTQRIVTESSQEVVTEQSHEVLIEATQEVIAELTQELVTEPSKEAVTELTPEVVTNPIQEVVTKPTQQIVTESSQELVTEQSHEVLTEQTQEIVTELTKEIITNPTQEIVTELNKEVIAEPSLEVVTEPTKEKAKIYLTNPIDE